MAPTQQDFEKEAADIHVNLVPFVPGGVVAAYIGARCETLQATNHLFKPALFYKACLSGSTVTEEAPNGDRN